MAHRTHNAFLNGMDARSYARLSENLKLVDLSLGQHVLKQGVMAEWVYFPQSCLLSLISLGDGGQTLETSMSGLEGAAGLMEACGSGQSSVDCVVQVDGAAWRSPASHCRALAYSDSAFNADAWKLAELQMAESRQSGLCQAAHPVEARAARWLLESLERSGGRNPLPLTQEFLASMLGVQRTTVSAIAADLQRQGLITYARGQVRILNPEMLQLIACECREATKRQRARLSLNLSPSEA